MKTAQHRRQTASFASSGQRSGSGIGRLTPHPGGLRDRVRRRRRYVVEGRRGSLVRDVVERDGGEFEPSSGAALSRAVAVRLAASVG
jgi:hypothetical protein